MRIIKKKLWNIKIAVVPMLIVAVGTVSKGFVRKLDELKWENERRSSKLQHCWEQPEYWEESWRLEETYCHLDFGERPSAIIGISLPLTRQDLTQSQWPEGRLKVGIRGGEDRTRAEVRNLLDFAGHRQPLGNVSLFSLACWSTQTLVSSTW